MHKILSSPDQRYEVFTPRRVPKTRHSRSSRHAGAELALGNPRPGLLQPDSIKYYCKSRVQIDLLEQILGSVATNMLCLGSESVKARSSIYTLEITTAYLRSTTKAEDLQYCCLYLPRPLLRNTSHQA
jgi:hypothetical protein